MRAESTARAFLLTLTALGTRSLNGEEMIPSIRILTERLGGLHVISSADPGFDHQMTDLYGKNAPRSGRT